MKLAYQSPGASVTGIRIYESETSGEILEVRPQMMTHRVFAEVEDFNRAPEPWVQLAKKLVLQDIERAGGEPFGDTEVREADNFSVYGRQSNQRSCDVVAVDVLQPFWPTVGEVD